MATIIRSISYSSIEIISSSSIIEPIVVVATIVVIVGPWSISLFLTVSGVVTMLVAIETFNSPYSSIGIF